VKNRITRDQLAHLNSMTKYPSIPTYHTLDKTNGLISGPVVEFTGQVIGSEKIDGSSSRVIVFPDHNWIIGISEELLTAQSDLIHNPALGIVDTLRNIAEHIATADHDAITVYHLEVYGGGVGGQWKHYTGDRRQTGARLFDVAVYDQADDILGWPRERIASWRDSGGQWFARETELWEYAGLHGLEVAPRLLNILAEDLPTGLEETRAFLAAHMPKTLVALDGAEPGRSEGIVLRTENRSVIAKARFEDYDRTLKRLAKTGK